MKIQEVLLEHVINLHTPEEKAKYADLVWDMLQKSYAKAGGFKSAVSPKELIDTAGIWKLVRRDGKVTAVQIYRDQYGRKAIAAGTDGSDEGKADLSKMSSEDVELKRAWGEFSGRMAEWIESLGGKPIPNNFVKTLVHKEIISLNPDGYHYTRLIQGEPHEKILYGFPHLDKETAAALQAKGMDIHFFK